MGDTCVWNENQIEENRKGSSVEDKSIGPFAKQREWLAGARTSRLWGKALLPVPISSPTSHTTVPNHKHWSGITFPGCTAQGGPHCRCPQ